jgi:transcriptional regulator with XRE-family HTH domain
MATPGGNRLRALREYHSKTQLEVELDASLGIGYLQRVESGKVNYPERDTLERILAALNAHYTERREILELFGYVVDAPLPNDAEIRQAIEGCRADLQTAALPASQIIRQQTISGHEACVHAAAAVRPGRRCHRADR